MCEPTLHQIPRHTLYISHPNQTQFLDQSELHSAGFSSRKEMRRSTYSRAKVLATPRTHSSRCTRGLANKICKVLYDLEYERNRITLIQAVLLMGFWYADTEDRTGPWHWIGVAISLCQTVGLHRRPDSIARSVSASLERLWRQIWWACIFRDTWFSVGMGRPMHINLDDCDTPMPDANDSDELLRGIPDTTRKKYLPDAVEDLSRLWVELLRLTIVLAGVLSTHYRVGRTELSISEVEQAERKIIACCRSGDSLKSSCDRTVSLHIHHLELYLE